MVVQLLIDKENRSTMLSYNEIIDKKWRVCWIFEGLY